MNKDAFQAAVDTWLSALTPATAAVLNVLCGCLLCLQRLPDQARALLLRLLLRKRCWFQLSGLSYADVPDPTAAAQQLARAGFVMWSHDELAPLDSLMQELPVAVLKPVLAALLPRNHPAIASSSAHSTQKEALISSIQVRI
jgi:hypothetical protein